VLLMGTESKKRPKFGRQCLTCAKYPKECREGTIVANACAGYVASNDEKREIFKDGDRVGKGE